MDDLFNAPLPEASPEPAAEAPQAKPKKAAKAQPAEAALEPDAPSAEAKAALIVAEAQANPVALFTDEKRYSQFYEKVAAAVKGQPADLSTAKGRAAIAALAFRVTKSKTALDAAGKGLTEDWRKQTAAVNASRAKMVAELDALAKEVRAPLTQWEEAEKVRLAKIDAELARFRQEAIIQEDESAASIEARGRALHSEELDASVFGERLEEAQAAKADAARTLAQAMHRARQAEKDAEELAQLRAAEAARQAKEEEERIAREAEEERQRIAREAEAAEAARIERERLAEEERERAEKERIRLAAEKAAQDARDEAERIRKAEEEERESARRIAEEEREAALAAERRENERALAAAQAEADKAREDAARLERERLEREEHERAEKAAADAEAARLAKLEEERQANAEHRKRIVGEAMSDLVQFTASGDFPGSGLDEKAAKLVILAIAAGQLRHLIIKF